MVAKTTVIRKVASRMILMGRLGTKGKQTKCSKKRVKAMRKTKAITARRDLV